MKIDTARRAWLVRRSALALLLVAGTTTLTFLMIHAAPGDPIYLLAGDSGTPDYYADMRAKYGLNRPLVEQFGRYVRAVAGVDFGYSFMYQAPVARVLADHALPTVLLAFSSLVLASAGGFALGVLAGARPGGAIDVGLNALAAAAYSAPVFWTGQLLILGIAVKLHVLPAGGMTSTRDDLFGIRYATDVASHLVLPAVTLSLPFMAVVARLARTAVAEALREPFILAARARGLPSIRIVVRHAAVNALVPVVALIGEHSTSVVAGAALTEALFGWPGLGYLVMQASLHRDYPVVTGCFIVISSSVVLFNAVTDLACAYLDPRITLS